MFPEIWPVERTTLFLIMVKVFCVFNDVAVAIRVLRQSMWVNTVLVIDLDVHQGNGTAAIFRR